jgi:hypothetical protein
MDGKSNRREALFLLVVLALAGSRAAAFSRSRHEDADVVARSEQIVVARVQEGSIRREPLRDGLTGAAAYIHHAMLSVTEVIKGDLKETQIPIIIHYGLLPVVRGKTRPAGAPRDIRGRRGDEAEGSIRIGDMATHSFAPLAVEDARTDNLWFLRRRSGYFGREPGQGDYGIVDPEDLQPLALKGYFLAYLSAEPEAAVHRAIARDPAVAGRGQRFLDRQEVHRLLAIDDPRRRVERLLPHFLKGLGSGEYFEARSGIVGCGQVAGSALWSVYRDPRSSFLREDVIRMWGEIGYRGCVPELIILLKEHDRFWAAQDLEADWWNRDVYGTRTGKRRDVWCEDLSAVRALGRIGDPAARPVVEAVRRRWDAFAFEPRGIVEACDEALRSL